MNYSFTIEVAGIPIEINCNSAKIKEYCKNFIVERSPEITVCSSEKEVNEFFNLGEGSRDYCEMLSVFKSVAEKLPLTDRFVLHGAGIKYKNDGIIFLASSGVGKTTHINLWKKYLGAKAEIINGDKPVLKVEGDLTYFYDTPWRGKEGYGNKGNAKLKAFCVIKRANENKITALTPEQALKELVNRLYLPENEVAVQKTLSFLEKLVYIPFFQLECNMEKQAFITAFNKLTGENYED